MSQRNANVMFFLRHRQSTHALDDTFDTFHQQLQSPLSGVSLYAYRRWM